MNNTVVISRCFFIIVLTFCVDKLLAQNIFGRVIDNDTKLPLDHAHVAWLETGEGTITDEDGNFKVIFKDIRKSKTIIVSYVGYQAIKKILLQGDTKLLFELLPDTTLLKDVVITPPNPVELVRSALNKIEENHGGQRLFTCFYRRVTKNKDKYIQISEASYELNQSPVYYNQLKVLKAREAEDEKAFNGVQMGIGTPVGAVRNMDFTMKPEESLFSKENLKKQTVGYRN